jgi:hypothetical protein
LAATNRSVPEAFSEDLQTDCEFGEGTSWRLQLSCRIVQKRKDAMRKVLKCAAVLVVTGTCFGQAQIKTNPSIQVNIDNTGTNSSIQLPRLGSQFGRGSIFSVCDKNDVLLDVLNSIAEPAFVKQEVDYETSNNLISDAIYNRRIGVIKALAGKK